MKRLIFSVFLLLSISACNNYESQHIAAYKEFLKKFSEYVFDKYDLQLSAEGGGFMLNINNISLDYYYPDNFSEEKSIDFLRTIVQDFHTMINADRNLRPYFNIYPFPLKQINISLSFHENPGKIYGISYFHNHLHIHTLYTNGIKRELLENFYIYKTQPLETYKRTVSYDYFHSKSLKTLDKRHI